MQKQLDSDIETVKKLISKFNATKSHLDRQGVYLEASKQLQTLNKHLSEFKMESTDTSEYIYFESKTNDLVRECINMREDVEKNVKFQQQTTATGEVTDLLESG
jgi:wobble nucleotide-excising tRNase